MDKIDEMKTAGFEQPTVFAKFTKLAIDTQSVNMGQGFPNWKPPQFFVDSLLKHCTDGNYQYCNGRGIPRLNKLIAETWSKPLNRTIEPSSEVLVANGAVSALYAAFTALLEKDDEVITFEPFFDCYIPQVKFVGAKLIGIHLTPPNPRPRSEFEKIGPNDNDKWTIDMDLLKKTINDKTRIIVLNTPNNPTGKIMSMDELIQIAEIVKNYPKIIFLLDEVYEFHLFSELELPRFQNIPGMWERSLSFHSAGKIFSVTGTRIGWVIGPASLINLIYPIVQNTSFCVFEPMQQAIADSFEEAVKPYEGYDNYYIYLREHYIKSRNYFIEELAKIKGFDVDLYLPDGGFFVVCGISKHNPEDKYGTIPGEEHLRSVYNKDYKYLINLANDVKLVGIPCSALCKDNKKIGENFIRFAICKTVGYLENAIANLKTHF